MSKVSAPRVHIAAVDLNTHSRHGGYRRTAQLASLAEASLTCVVPAYTSVPRTQAWRFIMRGWRQTASGLTLRGRLKAAFAIGHLLSALKDAGIQAHKAQFLFEMCYGSNLHLGNWLAKQQYAYVVAPHNIEFLVPNQANPDCRPGIHFELETGIYRNARAVLCISEVDSFIARCIGARAHTLPYAPTGKEQLRFEAIRGARAAGSVESSTLLYIGTVFNPPTRAGLERLIREFEQDFPPPWRLHIAGYGTEQLIQRSTDRIVVEGTVSDARLDELLKATMAVLVHQPATTGFLTRLVEMNLCGVPVFVNRSYLPATGLQAQGIHTYATLSEVQQLLSTLGRLEAIEPLIEPSRNLDATQLWQWLESA